MSEPKPAVHPTASSTRKKPVRPSAKPERREVTHTDFMNFLEPFCSPVTSARYKELLEFSTRKEEKLSSHLYDEYRPDMKTRLTNCYILNKPVDIDALFIEAGVEGGFQKEMNPIMEPLYSGRLAREEFLFENRVLEEFLNRDSIEHKEFERLKTNNRRMISRVSALILSRARMHGYFQAHDLIHRELEETYRRTRQRRKKGLEKMEQTTVREYLGRMGEFYEHFGRPEQFPVDCMIYPDVISGDGDYTFMMTGTDYLP